MKSFFTMLPMSRKKIMSAGLHNSRLSPPKYILPSSKNEFLVSDNYTYNSKELNELWNYARPSIKNRKSYSPVWEGVLGFPRGLTKETMLEKSERFARALEQKYKYKVCGVFVHNDEGYIENGKTFKNPHAHIVLDRYTNNFSDDGIPRAVALKKKDLIQIQNLAAQHSGLPRAAPYHQTGQHRKHIKSGEYRQIKKHLKGFIKNEAQLKDEIAFYENITDKYCQEIDSYTSLMKQIVSSNNFASVGNLIYDTYQKAKKDCDISQLKDLTKSYVNYVRKEMVYRNDVRKKEKLPEFFTQEHYKVLGEMARNARRSDNIRGLDEFFECRFDKILLYEDDDKNELLNQSNENDDFSL